MQNARIDILLRPVFLVGLGILLLNDFWLKFFYPGFLTGKLSDFAGLFIFPYFFSSFKISNARLIYFTTGIFFILWKSELSESAISFFQSSGINIDRVVDATDLTAIAILPVSYSYFLKQLKIHQLKNKFLLVPVSVICVFAFTATSLQSKKIDINLKVNKGYRVNMSKETFLDSLQNLHADDADTKLTLSVRQCLLSLFPYLKCFKCTNNCTRGYKTD